MTKTVATKLSEISHRRHNSDPEVHELAREATDEIERLQRDLEDCIASHQKQNAEVDKLERQLESRAAEIKQFQGTLRIVAGLIHDALPSAQGSAAESLAHAYEAIETTLVGVVAHESTAKTAPVMRDEDLWNTGLGYPTPKR